MKDFFAGLSPVESTLLLVSIAVLITVVFTLVVTRFNNDKQDMKKLILLSVLAIVVASCGYEIRKKPEPPKPKLTKEQIRKQVNKD